MAKISRRYYIPSKQDLVSAKDLKALSPLEQREAMEYWFHDRYDDPINLPYNSAEGGYQWIHGGPYGPEDVISNEFYDIVSEEVMNELISELESKNSEWSGKASKDAYQDFDLEELAKSGIEPILTLIWSIEETESAARIRTNDVKQKVLHKVLFANVITSLETFLADRFKKTLGIERQYFENFVTKSGHLES